MNRYVVAAAAVLSAACGPPLLKLPSGAGVPSAAERALADTVDDCARVATLTADVAVSGSVHGQRIRGHLSAGVAAPQSARLEAVVSFGPPLFIFVARDRDATLLLPRDNRVLLHGPPGMVLEAVTGVPADAADLHEILTGCSAPIGGAPARAFGDQWRLVSIGDDEVYFHREKAGAPWTLAAIVRRAPGGARRWRADFAARQDAVPRTIRLTSVDAAGRTGSEFDLSLQLSQVDINTPLGAAVFAVQVPQGAEPITIDELRRSGPFAVTPTDGR